MHKWLVIVDFREGTIHLRFMVVVWWWWAQYLIGGVLLWESCYCSINLVLILTEGGEREDSPSFSGEEKSLIMCSELLSSYSYLRILGLCSQQL